MNIRPFQIADESAVIALWQQCGLTRPWNDPGKDIARKLAVQAAGFLVGVIDGQIVATVMAGYEGHRGWINYLAVSPDQRQLGYGRAIMDAAEAWLRAAGCPKINLQIRSDNREAIVFYERLGFVEDAVVSYGKRLVSD